MTIRRRDILTAALSILPLSVPGFVRFARAQPAWPNRAIRLVVPYAPGGNVDILARLIGPRLAEALGQPVIVDNRPGAAGAIGAAEAARAEADGHVLLVGDIATHAINPALNDQLSYRPAEDFRPVARLTSVSLLLVAAPQAGLNSVAELVQAARAAPERLTYASAGPGSAQHFAFEYFKSLSGARATHVPYRGSAPALTDVMAGHVAVMIDGSALPAVHDGKLKALAVTGARRSEALPEVPTMIEAGVRDYVFTSWHGVFAPARTPGEVVARLNREINAALADPAVAARLAALNIERAPGSPDTFASFIAAEAAKLRTLAAAAGIKAN